jgi:hypothetical protein
VKAFYSLLSPYSSYPTKFPTSFFGGWGLVALCLRMYDIVVLCFVNVAFSSRWWAMFIDASYNLDYIMEKFVVNKCLVGAMPCSF